MRKRRHVAPQGARNAPEARIPPSVGDSVFGTAVATGHTGHSKPERSRVMIQGLITTNDVLRHTVLIVSSFGVVAWLRCCKAIVLGRSTTFLACALG